MIEGLEKAADLNIPKDLSSDEANEYLKDVCKKHENLIYNLNVSFYADVYYISFFFVGMAIFL
jgi:hypothetical protein